MWLRFIAPELLRAFWAGLWGRPFDEGAAIERVTARVIAVMRVTVR